MKISAWGGLGGSSGSGNHLEKCSLCRWPCSSPVCVLAGHTTWAFGTPPSMVRACTMMRRGPLPEGGCTPGPSGAKYQGGVFRGVDVQIRFLQLPLRPVRATSRSAVPAFPSEGRASGDDDRIAFFQSAPSFGSPMDTSPSCQRTPEGLDGPSHLPTLWREPAAETADAPRLPAAVSVAHPLAAHGLSSTPNTIGRLPPRHGRRGNPLPGPGICRHDRLHGRKAHREVFGPAASRGAG